VQKLVPEVREPHSHLGGAEGVELVLQVVDLAVDRVQQLEVGVGDVVDEPVDEDARGRSLLRRRN